MLTSFTELPTLLAATSSTFGLLILVLAYTPIYSMQPSGIRFMPKTYSIPAAFGLSILYILGTGSTLIVYMQSLGLTFVVHIQFLDTEFLPTTLGIGPTSAVYIPLLGIGATFTAYIQPSDITFTAAYI